MFFLLAAVCFLDFMACYAYEITIASMFRNEGPYLKEWIEFHKMVGVDHFILYNNDSQDNWKEVLTPYIREGLVEVIDWSSWYSYTAQKFPIQAQFSANIDALKKGKEDTEWLIFMDVDEFIFPKKTKTLLECLNTVYSQAGAVFVQWRNFGTNQMFLEPGVPILFYLTKASSLAYKRNTQGKTIIKPRLADLERFVSNHYCPLLSGSYFDGSGNSRFVDKLNPPWHAWSHSSDFLCMNHYCLRDENFFREKRLGPAKNKIGNYTESLILEQYQICNQIEELSIIEFVRTFHADKYEAFWRAHDPYK